MSATVGVKASCSSLNLPRETYYRYQDPEPQPAKPRPRPPLALEDEERQAVVEVLHSPRFVDRRGFVLDILGAPCPVDVGRLRSKADDSLRGPARCHPRRLSKGNDVYFGDID